jgi:signal transduction histidine kinase/CheY-like chemotaxis protein
MKAQDLDLDQLLVQRPDEGALLLRGGRALLADTAATYRLAEELEDTLGPAAARGVLTRFGYQTGYQEATRLRNYFPWESDLEWLRAGPRVQTILGVGRIELEEVVVDRAHGVFRVVAGVTNSFEAAEYKDRRGPAPDRCVCDRLAGYLSGFGSAFLGDEVLFIEQRCAVRDDGARACRFEGRLAAEWGEAGVEHHALYRRDAIGERLALRDREVLAQAVKIQEQELALAAKRRVEEASRLKSEFLANISHELRTPLNSIIGYSDLLITKLGPRLPDTPRKNLERILANAEHLLGLINSILDISKIEAGRMDVHLEPVDVRPLLDRCLEDARVLLGDKPVELQPLHQDVELRPVQADRVRLQQCLTNVLANAAKFTLRGSIRVECRTISGQRSGHAQGFLAVSVADTGPGIAPEHQALIFEPFRQVDASTTRAHGGTGLGLAIVRELLGLMGGEIRLVSTLGAGSTFTIILPLAEATAKVRRVEAATASDAPPAAGPEGGAPPEVLLIDDDPDFAALVREALTPEPGRPAAWTLRVERDPIHALASARVAPPAVVLLDLRLPNVDGREVLRLLRDDPRTRAVPVIVTSIRDDLAETLGEGARAALRKPVKPAALRGALEDARREREVSP